MDAEARMLHIYLCWSAVACAVLLRGWSEGYAAPGSGQKEHAGRRPWTPTSWRRQRRCAWKCRPIKSKVKKDYQKFSRKQLDRAHKQKSSFVCLLAYFHTGRVGCIRKSCGGCYDSCASLNFCLQIASSWYSNLILSSLDLQNQAQRRWLRYWTEILGVLPACPRFV